MVPEPLPSWGRRHLRDALAVNVPNTPRSSFTKPQQKNLVAFEQMVVSMVKKGTLQEDDVVVVSADRFHDPDITYEAKLSWNVCPTLATHNQYLVPMSVKDILNNTEDSAREFFRLLLLPERLQLQGFPAKLALWLPENKIVLASGNAYPVPLLIAMFFPMLQALLNAPFPVCDWPPPELLKTEMPCHIPRLLKALQMPGRIVDKEKNKQARLRAKRKRSGSDSS